MRKNHEAQARRALIESFIGALTTAVDHHQAIVRRMLDESDGKPVRPPPLELNGVTQDMLDTLLKGLRTTLDGKPNPFGIAVPGISTSLKRQEAIEAVSAVLDMRDLGEPVGPALAAVADRYHVSDETLRKWYQDDGIRGWADLQRNAY